MEWIWLLFLLVVAAFLACMENGRKGISCRNIERKLKSDLKLKEEGKKRLHFLDAHLAKKNPAWFWFLILMT